MWWGIWCKDSGKSGAWFTSPDGRAVCAYSTKKQACKIAAELYGFDSYTEAKKKGWVQVLLLCRR